MESGAAQDNATSPAVVVAVSAVGGEGGAAGWAYARLVPEAQTVALTVQSPTMELTSTKYVEPFTSPVMGYEVVDGLSNSEAVVQVAPLFAE